MDASDKYQTDRLRSVHIDFRGAALWGEVAVDSLDGKLAGIEAGSCPFA
jgi:hypothetical protein